jgi:hypothetical protein
VSGCLPCGCSGLRASRGQKKRRGGGEREQERGESGEQSQCQGAPDPSHGTKMLGKMLLAKKAHEKSLTSKNKV